MVATMVAQMNEGLANMFFVLAKEVFGYLHQ
jgi:hypothetical protein